MYLNGCTASITGGQEQDGYVIMTHKQSYGVFIRNGFSKRCNANIVIDGKSIGTWRLGAGEYATILRPADEDGQLTFYRTNSVEGRITDDGIGRQEEGLVQVTFTPEKVMRVTVTPPKPKRVREQFIYAGNETGDYEEIDFGENLRISGVEYRITGFPTRTSLRFKAVYEDAGCLPGGFPSRGKTTIRKFRQMIAEDNINAGD